MPTSVRRRVPLRQTACLAMTRSLTNMRRLKRKAPGTVRDAWDSIPSDRAGLLVRLTHRRDLLSRVRSAARRLIRACSTISIAAQPNPVNCPRPNVPLRNARPRLRIAAARERCMLVHTMRMARACITTRVNRRLAIALNARVVWTMLLHVLLLVVRIRRLQALHVGCVVPRMKKRKPTCRANRGVRHFLKSTRSACIPPQATSEQINRASAKSSRSSSLALLSCCSSSLSLSWRMAWARKQRRAPNKARR